MQENEFIKVLESCGAIIRDHYEQTAPGIYKLTEQKDVYIGDVNIGRIWTIHPPNSDSERELVTEIGGIKRIKINDGITKEQFLDFIEKTKLFNDNSPFKMLDYYINCINSIKTYINSKGIAIS